MQMRAAHSHEILTRERKAMRIMCSTAPPCSAAESELHENMLSSAIASDLKPSQAELNRRRSLIVSAMFTKQQGRSFTDESKKDIDDCGKLSH